MGISSVPIEVGNIEDRHYQAMEALVDTGATCLIVPRSVLTSLGVHATERGSFSLANGRSTEYDIGFVSLRLEGRALPTPCIFGDEDVESLLGAVSLEIFRLAPDPVNQRLISVSGRLMRAETA